MNLSVVKIRTLGDKFETWARARVVEINAEYYKLNTLSEKKGESSVEIKTLVKIISVEIIHMWIHIIIIIILIY